MTMLIPNIGTQIKQKLNHLNLEPLDDPKTFLERVKDKKHRYFSPCRTLQGDIIAFYARLHDNLDAKKKFLNEIYVLKKIQTSNFKIKEVTPKIISWGVEKKFEWFTRFYPTSSPLGYSRHLQKNISISIIPKLTECIHDILKIPKGFFGKKINTFPAQNYSINNICAGLATQGLISQKLCHNISSLIKKNKKILMQECCYYNHGDLNLGNILTNHTGIWIIDWELLHINNFAYDITYLWAHLWQAERFVRQQLMKSFVKQLDKKKLQKFKKLLPMVAAYLCMGGIPFQNTKNERGTQRYTRRRYYLRLLKNCLLSFEKLIKT